MATHEFLKKARAIDYAEHARATGYIAVLKKNKVTKGYSVYVYRKD